MTLKSKTTATVVSSASASVTKAQAVSTPGSNPSASASATTSSNSCRVVISTVPAVISGRTTVVSMTASACGTQGNSVTGTSATVSAAPVTSMSGSAGCMLQKFCTADVEMDGKHTRLTYLCPEATVSSMSDTSESSEVLSYPATANPFATKSRYVIRCFV